MAASNAAGRDQGAELGNGIGELQPPGHVGGSLEIEGSQLPVDLDRVTKSLIGAGNLRDLLRQRFHRPQPGLLRQLRGRKGEGVVQRHRSESRRDLAPLVLTVQFTVNRVARSTTVEGKLQRCAKDMLFITA